MGAPVAVSGERVLLDATPRFVEAVTEAGQISGQPDLRAPKKTALSAEPCDFPLSSQSNSALPPPFRKRARMSSWPLSCPVPTKTST
jgi:hypothetical protein